MTDLETAPPGAPPEEALVVEIRTADREALIETLCHEADRVADECLAAHLWLADVAESGGDAEAALESVRASWEAICGLTEAGAVLGLKTSLESAAGLLEALAEAVDHPIGLDGLCRDLAAEALQVCAAIQTQFRAVT